MDGLTISTSNALLKTGRTASQLDAAKMKVDGGHEKEGVSFSDTLKNAIVDVNKMQQEADVKMQQMAVGENKNIADVMLSVEKAEIAFQLMVQVRNKLMDAYQEIMKMQV